MPGIVMHHHFGKVVYSALPEEIKAVLNNVNVYDYGTSAPDSFSYVNFINNKNQKDSKAFSDYVHTHKTKDFFAKLVEISKVDYTMFNYLCGNITHYFLDVFTNPFISYHSGIYNSKDETTIIYRGLQRKLERAMDCYVIENYYDSKVNSFNIKNKILKLKKISKNSKESLDRLYLTVYGKNDGYKFVNSSIKWQRRYYSLIFDRFGLKNKFLTKRDDGISQNDYKQVSYYDKTININEIDIFNFKHNTWNNPVDKDMVSTDSFFDLLDKAKKVCVNCIQDLYTAIYGNETFDVEAYFKDLSYITGIPCTYDLEMKFFNIIFKKDLSKTN